MIRELKFKVWIKSGFDDDVKPYMANVDSINFETKSIFADGCEWDFSECILLQYTGLKDKNGKEIYEGDILKLLFYPLGARKQSEYSKTGIVRIYNFSRLGIKWEIEEKRFINLPEELKDNIFCESYKRKWVHPTNKNWLQCFDDVYKMEVIGNIHKNPELLTIKND